MTEVPQAIRDVLKEDLTDRGIQQWWDRYCDVRQSSGERDALEAAAEFVAYLEHRSGYYV